MRGNGSQGLEGFGGVAGQVLADLAEVGEDRRLIVGQEGMVVPVVEIAFIANRADLVEDFVDPVAGALHGFVSSPSSRLLPCR